jgi:hypothetical protein
MKGGSDRIDITQRTPTFPPADINDLISHVIYINLDARDDRKAHIERELSVFKPEKITRIPAVIDKNPKLGCSKSHIKALEMARDNKYPNVLIMEDDAMWTNVDVTYPILKRLLNEPHDGILLGTVDGATFDATTLRITFAETTSGYIVKEPFYQKYLDLYQAALSKLDPNNNGAFVLADGLSQEAYKAGTWYVVSPSLVTQLPSFSNINLQFKNLTPRFYK